MKKELERDIQKACLDWLRYNKFFAWKNPTIGTWNKATGHYIPSHNVGAPDIFAVKKGKIYAIECKRPGNRQSEQQMSWQQEYECFGGTYILAYSVDDLAQLDRK